MLDENSPLLLFQRDPRQIVSANRMATALFGKSLEEINGSRGGQVFDCLHASSPAGCGKDAHCEPCTIRKAIVDTLETGTARDGVSSDLPVGRDGAVQTFVLRIATERLGEHALVRIERYTPK